LLKLALGTTVERGSDIPIVINRKTIPDSAALLTNTISSPLLRTGNQRGSPSLTFSVLSGPPRAVRVREELLPLRAASIGESADKDDRQPRNSTPLGLDRLKREDRPPGLMAEPLC
jgi:hypothetical protein